MNYHTYINSPEWRAVSRAAKERAGLRCELCGATEAEEQLHTHHKSYSSLGHEEPADLVVLCRWCHRYWHLEEKIAGHQLAHPFVLKYLFRTNGIPCWGDAPKDRDPYEAHDDAKRIVREIVRQTQGGAFDWRLYDSCIRFLNAYLRFGATDPADTGGNDDE